MNVIYFECHVTVDPVTGWRLEDLAELARAHGFKVAALYKATGVVNDRDSFMTGHAGPNDLTGLQTRMAALIQQLADESFVLRRSKIEAVIEDSRTYAKS